MPWDIIFLGMLITILGMSAIIMANKTKNTTKVIHSDTNIEALAEAVGERIALKLAKELRDILLSIPQGNRGYSGGSNRTRDLPNIEMDESVVPMKVDTSNIQANSYSMATEEVKVDKGLDKSKSKLKALLGKKDEG